MADELRTEVEQVKNRTDVKQALKQTTGAEPAPAPVAETKDKLWLGTHVLLFFILVGVYFLLQFRFFGFAGRYVSLLQKLDLAAMAVVLLLAAAKTVDVYL